MFGGQEFDALGFKQVGDSFLYLRGGYSEAGLRSFPCDVLILDEYDQLDASAVSLARRRLNASLVRREIRISTPTIPGRGISAAYADSDQRIYQTKCSSCATECSACGSSATGPKGAVCQAVYSDGHRCQGTFATFNS